MRPILNVYDAGAGIYGTRESDARDFPATLRAQVKAVLEKEWIPNFIHLENRSGRYIREDPSALKTYIRMGVTPYCLVLHPTAGIIEAGESLEEKDLAQVPGRIIVLACSPFLLGSPDDPNGDTAIGIIVRALNAIARDQLSPGVYAIGPGGQGGPIPIKSAMLVEGRIRRKQA